jgi:GH25 family lysozyme M1 (1,4-beta-N-acetylmuramidase)
MSDSDYMKKRMRDKIKGSINVVVAKVISYELKQPSIFDYYEGEAPLDWKSIQTLKPLRLVFQATVGAHGRHGDNKPDREVAHFIQSSLDNGLKYGLYHLLIPGDIQRQADFYINTVEQLGGLGDMMPITDVEVSWTQGKVWAADVKAWLDLIEAHFHQKALIYTSKYYWSFLNYFQIITGAKKPILASPPWTKDYPGWFAGYPWVPYLNANHTLPRSYQASGFVDWAVWQYYDQGRPRFPANDLNLVSPWFAALLENYGV